MTSMFAACRLQAENRGWAAARGATIAVAIVLGCASSAQARVFTATSSSVQTTLGGTPTALAAGDLDGDPIPDLATANLDATVSALQNDGSANFVPLPCTGGPCSDGTFFTAGGSPSAAAIGDLNQDGRNDLVIADSGIVLGVGGVNVFTANADAATNPDGSFSQATADDGLHTFTNADAGPFPAAVAIGDLNGDGMPDLAVANSGGSPGLTVLLRSTPTGAGTSVTEADYTSSQVATTTSAFGADPAIAIGDLNGDGKQDIAITDESARTVIVLYQTAAGFDSVLVPTNTVGPGPTSVAIGDLGGDGQQDLVVASNNSDQVFPLIKDAAGTGFTPAPALTSGGDAKGLAVGDLDGDGRNDIAVADFKVSKVTVFLRDATGTTYTPTILDNTESGALVIADLAGTGKLDIATSADFDTSVTILTNTTPQTTTTSLAAAPASPAFGDAVTMTSTVAKVVSGLRGSVDPTGTVTYTVDGRALTPTPLSGGTAALTTSALGVGSHTITADYSGDADYAASTATITKTITAATTVTGDHAGQLDVTGTTHVHDAHITGAVVVHAGATLDLENTTIDGDLTAAGAGAIRICGNTIGGSVSIVNSAGLVVLGDTADALCAVNGIVGALSLTGNAHGVRAIGNSVGTQPVTDTGNSGPGPFPGDVTSIANNLALALAVPSPTSATFADTIVANASAGRTITISNPTNIALHVTTVAIAGAQAGQFTLTGAAGCQTTIAAHSGCSVVVTFAPTSTGPKSASLDVTSDAVSSPTHIALSGTGVTPPTLDPSAVSAPFGEVVLATTSAPKTFTITNGGGASLHISSASVIGDAAGQFAISADSCTGVVAPGGHCTIDVTFAPAFVGAQSAVLRVVSDAASSPDDFALAGSGVAAPIGVPVPAQPPAPAPIGLPAPAPAPTGASTIVKLTKAKAGSKGTITVTLSVPGAGRVTVVTTSKLPAVKAAKGRKARKAKTITFAAKAASTTTKSTTVTIKLKPSKAAAAALKQAKRLRVHIAVTFKPKSGASTTQAAGVTVRR